MFMNFFKCLSLHILKQSHVCSLGRLSHTNTVNFLGYCLEDKELFLVHEFMQNGSFENHLFIREIFVQCFGSIANNLASPTGNDLPLKF